MPLEDYAYSELEGWWMSWRDGSSVDYGNNEWKELYDAQQWAEVLGCGMFIFYTSTKSSSEVFSTNKIYPKENQGMYFA